jgi:hypothetical protein
LIIFGKNRVGLHFGKFTHELIWSPCPPRSAGRKSRNYFNFWWKFAAKQLSAAWNVTRGQCCQMVYFQTQNANLGKFWSALQWKMLVNYMASSSTCFTALWYILCSFGIFCGHFGIFFPVLVCKKNLATLLVDRPRPRFRKMNAKLKLFIILCMLALFLLISLAT